MATNKNITMKQYNGLDYDTLYPKTILSQVEGASAQLSQLQQNIGQLQENINQLQQNIDGKAPAYQYSTADITAGVTALATGTLYFVYE